MKACSGLRKSSDGMAHISSGHHWTVVTKNGQCFNNNAELRLTIKYGNVEISSPRLATRISVRVSRAAERLAA
jgi:hypothetical protein